MDEGESAVELRLTRDEIELLKNALGHLEATLGREEAAELEQVQALKAKLARLNAS